MKRNVVLCGVLLAAMVLALFGGYLFWGGDRVAAYVRSDINMYFSGSRSFGFGEVAAGHVPLWNPHVFSGSTFVGNFQSALFYPPNLMYCVLPLAKAFNADLAFHVLLFGLLTFAWAVGRGQRSFAAALAGTCAMFGGAFYLHVFAGHLTMLAGFAWMPLVFLAIDKTFERPRVSWAATGAVAVTMQVLSGLPQVLLVTAVSAGLYVALRLIELAASRRAGRPRVWRVIVALSVIAMAPVFLGAIQLWPGLEAARLSTRGEGVPLDFANSFSFPWANLAMLLVPHAFGGDANSMYWSRWLFWEVSLYMGAAAFVLALYGAIRARGYWPFAAVAAVLLIIALGRYAPLFKLLYAYVPGFSSFRGPARFLTPVSLLLSMLAGAGADKLLGLEKGWRRFAFVPLVLALALAVSGALLRRASANPDPEWEKSLAAAASYIRYDQPHSVAINVTTARNYWFTTSGQLSISAVVLALLGVCWALSGRYKTAAYLAVAMAMGEVFVLGWRHRGEFELNQETLAPLQDFAAIHGEDARILHLAPTHPQLETAQLFDVWGYDPVVNERYAEFFSEANGISKSMIGAGITNSFLEWARPGELMRLVRLQAVVSAKGQMRDMRRQLQPLPRFFFLRAHKVVPDFDDVFDVMQDPAFDPMGTVVLQEKPEPEPVFDPFANAENLEVVESGADYAVLEVGLEAPAVLLNTDAYAPGWRVVPLAKGPQAAYRVLRADYAIRAIPLAAGVHKIRLEYMPGSFRAGRAASLAAAGVIAGLGFAVWGLGKRRRNRGRSGPSGHQDGAPSNCSQAPK